jgi:hypothetical protein
MRLHRVMAFLALSLLLYGVQALLMTDRAYAQSVGCCNCWWPYGPNGCYPCGNCYVRAQALLEQLVGNQFTLTNKKGGGIEVEASQDVINQLLDLRQHGKIAYGDYIFQASGSGKNLTLRCVGFVPIDKEKENRVTDESKDPKLKKNNEEFEKLDKVPPKGAKGE